MSYLIDTNVLSELRKPKPAEHVVAWFDERPATALYLSVLTVGELRKGVELLPRSARKLKLLDWLDTELPTFFAGRILPIDATTCDIWGRLLAQIKRPMPAIDSLLAATAVQHNLRMVTRNVRDFADYPGLETVDPWAE